MADRKTAIAKAAYDLMGTKGLEGVHARTVAAVVGLNHATVHYYFPRRPDLLHGVADYALEVFAQDRAKFLEGATNAADRLGGELGLAEAYCKKTSRFVKVLAGLYVAGVADASLRKKLKGLWAAWVDGLSAATGKGKASPFKDPELTAATLFGLALASHLVDGTLDSDAKIDAVYASLTG